MTTTIRAAVLPDDQQAIAKIDRTFTTDVVYDVSRSEDGFALQLTGMPTAVTKQLPLDDLMDPEPPWDFAEVAVVDGLVRSFLAAGIQPWNRRLVIWHLYVDLPWRRKGIGRALMESAFEYGRSREAITAWLETSNLNAPAIAAYRRMGFELCGLDRTMYHGTDSAAETALFMARPLRDA